MTAQQLAAVASLVPLRIRLLLAGVFVGIFALGAAFAFAVLALLRGLGVCHGS